MDLAKYTLRKISTTKSTTYAYHDCVVAIEAASSVILLQAPPVHIPLCAVALPPCTVTWTFHWNK